MLTIEVFADRHLPHAHELTDRLLREVITEEGAPEVVLANTRELTHVMVHEPAVWATGGSEGPRYVVRLTVPGSWNSKQMGEHIVSRVTGIFAAFEDDPQRLLRAPHCMVQIVGLREHAVGTLGRVTTSGDITRMMTDGYRGAADRAAHDPNVDPVCGMAVDPSTSQLTLEVDGVVYAFCAPSCRKVFAEEHAVALWQAPAMGATHRGQRSMPRTRRPVAECAGVGPGAYPSPTARPCREQRARARRAAAPGHADSRTTRETTRTCPKDDGRRGPRDL